MASNRGSFPLPIYDDDDDDRPSSSRGRGGGRRRGRGRGPRSRPPSRNRASANEHSETNQDEMTRHRLSSNRGKGGYQGRGDDRGKGDSRGRADRRGGRGRDGNNSSTRYRDGSSVTRHKHHQSNLNINQDSDEDSGDGDIRGAAQVKINKRSKEVRTMSFQKLVSLADTDNDPDTVLMAISHSLSGFHNYLSSKLFQKNAFYIIRLAAAACKSSNVHTLRTFLEKLIELSLLTELNTFLNSVMIKDRTLASVWTNKIKLSSFCRYCAEILKVVMSSLSLHLAQCFGIYNTLKQVCSEHDLSADFDDVLDVFNKVKHEREKSAEAKPIQRRSRYTTDDTEESPPNDFRTISIFPTMKDIHLDETPFLRANRTKGKYESLETYLDIQFRLLREDYLRPLREGIDEYRSCIRGGLKLGKSRNIRVYQNVQILRPVCASKGINHIIQFDSGQFKNMNWTSSRRLLFGSLICMSCDHFETVHYATIAERNAKDLENGYIEVHFEAQSNEALTSSRTETFVMAETTAYFEAYRYILEGLQEIEDPLSFSPYILNCETHVKPPEYLTAWSTPSYDFSCLLSEEARKTDYLVLEESKWPMPSKLGLDITQYTALRTAITKEFAIIQGPPGTGKTYVGLKITQLLLANSVFWNTKSSQQNSPILVVCYTNHALDQFLEGILNLCTDTDIIRIGGRCKNEALEPYTLSNVKKKMRESKKRTFSLMQRERDCLASVKRNEQHITKTSKQLLKTTTQIISFDQLKDDMTSEQFNSFSSRDADIFQWLSCPHLQKQTSTFLDHEQVIRQDWVNFLLTEVKPMVDIERNLIKNIWKLALKERAELYKAWLVEVLDNIDKFKLQEPSHIECQQGILHWNQLVRCVADPLSISQLQQMYNECPIQLNPGLDMMEVWICLFGKKNAIQDMRLTIDAYEDKNVMNGPEDEDEDLEEERPLDDDEEFMFESARDREAKRKQKHSETNQEWVIKRSKKKIAHSVQKLLKNATPLSDSEADFYSNLWNLGHATRLSLYCYWLNKYRQRLKDAIKVFECQFNNDIKSLIEARDQETIEVLKGCGVMGMTTTGAAKYRNILQKVKPQITIVEEAAEVLESHIITTLNSSSKHLILIGDHKQLRPSTTVYELSKKFGMDISLFERMVRNDVPCVTLEEQHRMRPEISALMRRDRLYPKLRDHHSVSKYDNVKGVERNLQFITHTEPEVTSKESTSYSNPHEAKYIAQLTKYFINQGYKREQITVLTPYMGQVLLLRKEMPKDVFEGVRITAVDNFQGEENTIILLSLVRSSSGSSNRRNPIGFVGIENRICVSLSRAREGMFVIGNFSLIRTCSEMWEDMILELEEKGCVKKGLLLKCSNHPGQTTFAEVPSDFKNVPEGGCRLPCDKKLQCGHICPKFCHIVDANHLQTACTRPCGKIVCDNGHICTKPCYKKCGDCLTKVEKTIPGCLHKASIPCSKNPVDWKCQKKCEAKLPCGHYCQKTCFECKTIGIHTEECQEIVIKTISCGHTEKLECHKPVDPSKCQKTCTSILDCGHKCSGKCGTCFGGRIHMPCKGTCNKIRPCGHTCSFPCTEICPPCTRQCGWVCAHGQRCKNKCFQPCTECTQTCCFKCEHRACDHECKDECNVSKCEEKCTERLKCGHGCRGLCGELCVCITCNSDKLQNPIGQSFDENSRFVLLPDCRCIFEYSDLDKYMASATNRRGDMSKRCPNCNKPISTNIRRYANALKNVRKAILTKYDSIYGSESERLSQVKRFQQKLKKLEKEGLDKSIIQRLNNSLQSNAFQSLRGFEKKYEIISEVLNISKYKEHQQNQPETTEFPFVLTTNELIGAVAADRKFINSQFWNEIIQETKRLVLALSLSGLKKRIVLFPKKLKDITPIVDETIKVVNLIPFNNRRQKLVSSAVELVKGIESGDLVSTSDDITNMMSELQFEQTEVDDIPCEQEGKTIKAPLTAPKAKRGNDKLVDELDSKPELDVRPLNTESNVDLANSRSDVDLPKPLSNVDLSKPRSNNYLLNQDSDAESPDNIDDIDVDVTESDFTGTIEIQMTNASVGTSPDVLNIPLQQSSHLQHKTRPIPMPRMNFEKIIAENDEKDNRDHVIKPVIKKTLVPE